MIKNELLKNTDENKIHANFRDENSIFAKLISSSARPICNHSC